jgi:DNA polymerase-1
MTNKSNKTILFLGTAFDRPYLAYLKQPITNSGARGIVSLEPVKLKIELELLIKRNKLDAVVTTQESLIPMLFPSSSSKAQKLTDYAGSYTLFNGCEIIFVPPLKQCLTVNYGQFLLNRYVSKITQPQKWLSDSLDSLDSFSYKLLETPEDYSDLLYLITQSSLLSVDLETRKNNSIKSISFSVLINSIYNFTFPLPLSLPVSEYEYRFAWIHKFLNTGTPIIGQNFQYDLSYLTLFGIPVTNYLFDTAVMHHCWYAELPKSLDMLANFYIKDSYFWKNEGDNDEANLYRYNALDTYNTLRVALQWLKESPDWAKQNYLIEFPIVFPSFLMSCTGIKVDVNKFREAKDTQQAQADSIKDELEFITSCKGFNPSSPVQVKTLLTILKCGDLKGTEEKLLRKAAFRHPFNHVVVDLILKYREAAKLVSTYLKEDKLFSHILSSLSDESRARMLSSFIPYGTTTGRLSSSSHPFYALDAEDKSEATHKKIGCNLQNIPRDNLSIKECYVADEGYSFCEIDYSQAESRDTGYISGDVNLINAVDGDKDFHSFNGSSFFGVPYESISEDTKVIKDDGTIEIHRKVLDKELRQLAKPINHGKSYGMGSSVLVDTMGLDKIYKAGQRLGLAKSFSALKIADFLGAKFEATYPVLTGEYYSWIKHQVSKVKLLVGATGWTRYCFGDPIKNKLDLNSYIAHPSQSLNAMTLNKAVMKVFRTVWFDELNNGTFGLMLHAQIHDSIFFSFKDGREDLIPKVKDCMYIPTKVKDIFGIERTLIVPAEESKAGQSWKEIKG